jgi:hypothetical protein
VVFGPTIAIVLLIQCQLIIEIGNKDHQAYSAFWLFPAALASACVRSCMLSHGRARARVGLPSGGGRPVGPGVRGLVSGIGSFWRAGFLEFCGNSLLLAENCDRTTTNNTTEAQSAQRLNDGGRNRLRLDDPCRLWASLARAAHRPCCILAVVLAKLQCLSPVGRGRPGRIAVDRSGAWACSRLGARARVGLSPGGWEAGRAWCQGGLLPG